MAIFVGALGIIGAGLWNRPFAEYVPFLAAGMVVWLFVSAVINESCVLFVQSSGLFCQIRFEYSIMVFALVWRNFVVFLHNFVVFVLALLALAPHHIDWPVLLVLPGLALLLINAAWVALLFGVICLRFRDLQQLVASLVQIAMFITPIFWPPALLSDLKFFVFVTLNPLFHLIEVVRMPLLGNVPPMGTYVAVAILTVIGWAVTFAVFRQFRRRIAYWS